MPKSKNKRRKKNKYKYPKRTHKEAFWDTYKNNGNA